MSPEAPKVFTLQVTQNKIDQMLGMWRANPRLGTAAGILKGLVNEIEENGWTMTLEIGTTGLPGGDLISSEMRTDPDKAAITVLPGSKGGEFRVEVDADNGHLVLMKGEDLIGHLPPDQIDGITLTSE